MQARDVQWSHALWCALGDQRLLHGGVSQETAQRGHIIVPARLMDGKCDGWSVIVVIIIVVVERDE